MSPALLSLFMSKLIYVKLLLLLFVFTPNSYRVMKPGVTDRTFTECFTKICNDGKIRGVSFCAADPHGSCNGNGCKCDGGCIEGNATENFHRITGITSACSMNKTDDPITWNPYWW